MTYYFSFTPSSALFIPRRLGCIFGNQLIAGRRAKSARSTAFIVNAASMPTIVERSICPREEVRIALEEKAERYAEERSRP